MAKQVAIVGAGMAGASLAHLLDQAGQNVCVFDKGRGVGGRLATRRVGDLRFDHGAPFFGHQDASAAFLSQMQQFRKRQAAAVWPKETFVGLPKIGAVAKEMLENLTVTLDTRIVELSESSGAWWFKDDTDKAFGPFASVCLTVPVPQLLPLVANSGVAWKDLDQVTYDPCWTVMIGCANDLSLPEPIIKGSDGVIEMVIDNGSKPGRPKGCLVAHATPQWSRTHLEMEADVIAAKLHRAVVALAPEAAHADYVAAHRWRYARVSKPLGQPCLWDPKTRLGAAGDWCLGPNVSDAFDSARNLAAAMLKDMGESRDAIAETATSL